jgi:hypothetical protein
LGITGRVGIMARIPDPKQFARLFRQMDLPARARLDQKMRAGKIGDDAEEATLLAGAAQRELRGAGWTMVLLGLLAGLNLFTAFVIESAVRWTSVAVVIVAMIAVPVLYVRSRPLVRTLRLNRERAEGST